MNDNFTRRGDLWSPAGEHSSPLPSSALKHITKWNPCMSSWAESKFYRAGSEVKPRSDSDEGISERVRVAYQGKCNILLTSHQDSLRDPAAATPCASASLLAQQKFDSAQDDRLVVCFIWFSTWFLFFCNYSTSRLFWSKSSKCDIFQFHILVLKRKHFFHFLLQQKRTKI